MTELDWQMPESPHPLSEKESRLAKKMWKYKYYIKASTKLALSFQCDNWSYRNDPKFLER